MTEATAAPTPQGTRWSQEGALALLGNPKSFRWAIAVVLDCGGDDDQWMATVRQGTGEGARVGVLAVSGGAIAYSELLGPPKGAFGGPKRNQPRWNWSARAVDIESVSYDHWVQSRFTPYSTVTVRTRDARTVRFGIDWCRSYDALLCDIDELAGSVPAFTATAPLRSDGAYVAGRNDRDRFRVLIWDPAGGRLSRYAYLNPGEAWCDAHADPESRKWWDCVANGDGTFTYGDDRTTIYPVADGLVIGCDSWSSSTSQLLYERWSFVPAATLEAEAQRTPAKLSPSPGTPRLIGGRIEVEGWVPYRSTEELEARNAQQDPVSPVDMFEAAANRAINHGRGFFPAAYFEMYATQPDVAGEILAGGQIDLAVPVVLEVGCAAGPVGADNPAKVRPVGSLESALLVTFEDRVLLAWSEGTLHPRFHTETIGYDEIEAVNPFTLTAKLSKNPALEILTRRGRFVVTFTNNPDCMADLVWWRDVLVKRFSGWRPVFDGAELVRWVAPSR